MYIQTNNFLECQFGEKIWTHQHLYEIRTWPIGLNVQFPVYLREKDAYCVEFEETVDAGNHVIHTFGGLTGKCLYERRDGNEKKYSNLYIIFEADLYQGCCDEEIICDTNAVRGSGKIFFTPDRQVFNYCRRIAWDGNCIAKPKNLCEIVANNQISPWGLFKKKMYELARAKEEYEKECVLRACCARERVVSRHYHHLSASKKFMRGCRQ